MLLVVVLLAVIDLAPVVRALATPPRGRRPSPGKQLVQKLKQARHAQEVSCLLSEHGEHLNCFAVATAMSTLRRLGHARAALALFEETRARSGFVENVVTYNAAIAASGTLRDSARAAQLFAELQQNNFEPTIITYSSMISVCEKSKQWQRAFELFDELQQQRGLEPNVITYSALISACEKGGQWEKAFELFDELQQRGLEPDVITYNALISACETSGHYNEARTVFLEAHGRSFYPQLHSFPGALDLHDLIAPVARTAVRAALADLHLRPEDRQFSSLPTHGNFPVMSTRNSTAFKIRRTPGGSWSLSSPCVIGGRSQSEPSSVVVL